MKVLHATILIYGLAIWLSPSSHADWLTLPGSYSHDAMSGERVSQYAPVNAPAVPQVANFRTSGYTHFRSSLNYGQSADNYHRVEAWGDPVRPYGEWRFPYRPYSTPYPNWGPPYAGLGGVGRFGPGFGFGLGAGGPVVGVVGTPRQPVAPDPGGDGHEMRRRRSMPNPAAGTNGFAPYPSGIGTPYPVAPYYDGFHPNYRD